MKNEFQILENRRVRNPHNGRDYSFAKGERVTWTQLKRAGFTKAPTWTKELTIFEVQCIRNNVAINDVNKTKYDFTALDLVQIELITEHLLGLGLDRTEFCLGLGASHAFKGSDKEVLWVGVKMVAHEDIFLRDTGRPVTLNDNNFIAASTFLRRVENGGPLFVKDI